MKDVVLGLESVALLGFTLRKHNVLGGPLRESLPWRGVHAIGADAVMIETGRRPQRRAAHTEARDRHRASTSTC